MTAPRPDDERVATTEPPDTGPSDLIGLRLTVLLALGMLAVLAAFFFVGAVVGVLVLLAAVVIGILGSVREIRRAELSD
jgi:hypothetical protein